MLKSYSLCGIILRQTISFKKPDAADFLRTGLGLLNNLTPCRVKMAVRLVEISGKLQNSHIFDKIKLSEPTKNSNLIKKSSEVCVPATCS